MTVKWPFSTVISIRCENDLKDSYWDPFRREVGGEERG